MATARLHDWIYYTPRHLYGSVYILIMDKAIYDIIINLEYNFVHYFYYSRQIAIMYMKYI